MKNYRNGPNVAKMGMRVVSWGSSEHIRGIPIFSKMQGDLNVSLVGLEVTYSDNFL